MAETRRPKPVLVMLGVLVSAAMILIVLSLYWRSNPHEKVFHQALRTAVANNIRHAPVASFTGFPWDRVCVFRPYVDKDELERVIGKAYPEYDQLHWINDDGYWTAIFVSEQHGYVTMQMPIMEIGNLRIDLVRWGKCEPRDRATFRLSTEMRPGLAPSVIELIGEVKGNDQ